jgi:spoIIIJ-associated protein
MEWVETTARSVDEAKELALDQLGVVADDAEFEVLEEPRQGLFGRVRGEARVRARVRPAPVRPKQDRRRGRRNDNATTATTATNATNATNEAGEPDEAGATNEARPPRRGRRGGRNGSNGRPTSSEQGRDMTTDNQPPASDEGAEQEAAEQPVQEADVAQVREAALAFVGGLTTAFGFDATVDAKVEGNEIEVRVDGTSLGLLIGPGGRTLLGVQDLARVAAQRRLGDHDTRLRVDVAGYREKRRIALERFAQTVAEQVRSTGVALALDAMPSADRKVLHDALAEIDGVTSRSEGEEPNRRVVVVPS